ncbi:hypothetical protein SK128_014730, partial [Halocaridina rubra]
QNTSLSSSCSSTFNKLRIRNKAMVREKSAGTVCSISSFIMPTPTNSSATQLAPLTVGGSGSSIASVMTSQLLLLYYLLLYEDVRLNNTHQLLTTNHRVLSYSPHLFAQLPIRYLLSHAQREQRLYGGLFSSLVKLLVSHYPQLCLVEDWLYQSSSADSHLGILPPKVPLDHASVTK